MRVGAAWGLDSISATEGVYRASTGRFIAEGAHGALFDGVVEAGDELEGVGLIAGRGVVEVVVGDVEVDAQALPGGEHDADHGHGGVVAGLVPGRDEVSGLGEDDLAGKVAAVVF